jgi:hypothetical protein
MNPNITAHTLAESLKYSGLRVVERVAILCPQTSYILNNRGDTLCRDIWRTACRNDLARQDLTVEDLRRITKNPYLNRPLLESVLSYRGSDDTTRVDDRGLAAVAANPLATRDMLDRIVMHPGLTVGLIAPQNMQAYMMNVIVHGASMSIESPALTAVANNRKASDATLSRIANHPYTRDAALAAIARHSNASSVTLNNVAANHYASQATRESVQRRLALARTRAGEHYHNYQGQGGPGQGPSRISQFHHSFGRGISR